MNLSEYRRRSQGLADFLPWAALVAKGVVLNKDGSFQRTARFRGPDLDSATPAELVAITARLNNALLRRADADTRGAFVARSHDLRPRHRQWPDRRWTAARRRRRRRHRSCGCGDRRGRHRCYSRWPCRRGRRNRRHGACGRVRRGRRDAAYRAGGAAGVAEAAGSAAISPLRRAAASLKESFASGERAVMRGTAPAGSGGAGSSAASESPPAWAQRMKRSQTINRGVTAADHAIRSGDRPSGGSQVDLSEGE